MSNCFPVTVTVSGLTKKEMPPVEDFIHVEIPGLCIGGGDVGVGFSQQAGHLFLMRNTEGAKKEHFKYYQEHILIPGINSSAGSIATLTSMTVAKSLMNKLL